MKPTLTAILTIAFVSTLLGAGTLAYFSDTETSSGNTMTAGTMDLKVNDGSPNTWTDGVTATWTFSNMKPGDSKYGYVKVDNTGSIDADHLEITSNYTVTEESPVVESDTDPKTNLHPDWMAKNMTVTYAWYDDGDDFNLLTGQRIQGNNVVEQHDYWKIQDVDSDGRQTLYDLKYGNGGNGIDNLPAPDGDLYTFRMTVKLDESAGNDFQGDTFDLTIYFTLNQHTSQ